MTDLSFKLVRIRASDRGKALTPWVFCRDTLFAAILSRLGLVALVGVILLLALLLFSIQCKKPNFYKMKNYFLEMTLCYPL